MKIQTSQIQLHATKIDRHVGRKSIKQELQLNQDIETLMPHPLNERLYGEISADEDLVRSIQSMGVLSPLICNPERKILSGMRRWVAAKKAGLVVVPTITFCGTPIEEEFLLIESNRQRIKTQGQIAREATELLRIEKELAAQREKSGNPSPISDKGRAAGKVGESLGMGKNKVLQAAAVVEAANNGDPVAKQELDKLDRNETTVNAAHRAIKAAEIVEPTLPPNTEPKTGSILTGLRTECENSFPKGVVQRWSLKQTDDDVSVRLGRFNLKLIGISVATLRKIMTAVK